MKQLTEISREPVTVNYDQGYFEALDKHLVVTRGDKSSTASYPLLEAAAPGLGFNVYEYFIEVYPEKAVSEDYEILQCLGELGIKLSQEKAPVLLVNEHKPPRYTEEFMAVSFGFAAGVKFSARTDPIIGNGSIRPQLFAPQSVLFYEDIGVEFTQSLPIQSWNVHAVNHVGSYLLQRRTTETPYTHNATVVDDGGEMYVGNHEIEGFVQENPLLAPVVDGFRESYRNNGLNPEIGRSIARAFKLDVSDDEAKKLFWS